MTFRPQIAVLVSAVLFLSACFNAGTKQSAPDARDRSQAPSAAGEPGAATDSPASELAGTKWELLKIQSMDDTSWAPAHPSRYTLLFDPGGTAYMQFDCNQGNAEWSSEGPGQLAFTLIASTSALCQDDGLSERYARQFEYVRSYLLRDGHLFLATLADGAIIEFRPAE